MLEKTQKALDLLEQVANTYKIYAVLDIVNDARKEIKELREEKKECHEKKTD